MIWVKDMTGKSGALCEGVRFRAKDKLGNKYQYRYEGTEKRENGYNIHLSNLTDGTETYVEKAWFSQREIKIL